MNRWRRRYLAGLALLVSLAIVSPALRAASPETTIEGIRSELLKLPYYSVFDFLAFTYDKGTVTLSGFAYRGTLKDDSTRAVKRVEGVEQVVNKIQLLPVSRADDQLRWGVYYKIYRDPFLSRYAPGGSVLWGHRHQFGGGFHGLGGMFPGMEPAGDYPIHIIVKGLRVTLLGVVDSESDKTVAGMRAREVPGSLGLDNQLIVESGQ